MADQTAFMSMMAQNPRMMQSHALASEQQRLSAAMSPTAVSVANQHTPYIGKDSLAAQMVSSSRGERNVSSPHRTAGMSSPDIDQNNVHLARVSGQLRFVSSCCRWQPDAAQG